MICGDIRNYRSCYSVLCSWLVYEPIMQVDWAAMSISPPFSSSTSFNLVKGANDRISNSMVLRFKATSLSKPDTGSSFLLSLITVWDKNKTKKRREKSNILINVVLVYSCLLISCIMLFLQN